MFCSRPSLITVTAVTVAVVCVPLAAYAAFSDSYVSTEEVTAGSVVLTPTEVAGYELALSVSDLQPGDERSFRQALVHTGTLPLDAELLVEGVVGAEDGCTTDLEGLHDPDCDDDDGPGDLVEALELTLWVWPDTRGDCTAALSDDDVVFGPGPIGESGAAASELHRLSPGGALCVAGRALMPWTATPASIGDGVTFETRGMATEVLDSREVNVRNPEDVR
jgi:hypothetical protein